MRPEGQRVKRSAPTQWNSQSQEKAGVGEPSEPGAQSRGPSTLGVTQVLNISRGRFS